MNARAKINAALAEQWPGKPVKVVTVDLPLPLSANELTIPVDGRKIRTERYRSWIVDAGNRINAQRPGRVRGDYQLTLIINRRRTKIDLDNAIKATSDVLQENHVIDNDRQASRIVLEWSDEVEGSRAIIEAWTGPRSVPAERRAA